ncbi:MAG: 16S rRNA (cytidine(1402)-2'-O)-methyltransferase [Deltaproteobacteria bacterium]|nr:MAG: 16S rRNA (cytidine(1402)-2'-O)-methyltransferase [Deltaproteobacteria bacterium]UCF47859.1 MAG: 16S rRNA (cytidine(1402)-2'-O)-methyltransferase [Myxococcales bacterium]
MSGRLSVVATPIGCLEDITLRALRVLREADLILAEDTRHTRTLCAEHGIDTPMRSFHAHTNDDKVDIIVAELTKGAHYALVSDAGTPVVSDPGVYLVSRAAEAGVDVEAIPGPSAVLAALSVAGLPVRRFVFEGFLPRSGGDRARALDRVAQSDITVVLFESPHRVHATLDDLERKLGGERQIALCRELTKMYEQTIRGTVAEVRSELSDPARGEITVVVEGKSADGPVQDVDLEGLVSEWKREGLSTKEMSRKLQRDLGWKRNAAYQAILDALKPKQH